MATKQWITQLIAENKVMVFSKSYCPYCVKAKKALSRVLPESKYKVVEIEDMKNVSEIQSILSDLTGGRTVPRVFVDGKFIGGGDDTDALERSGKLKEMLTKIGVLP